MRRGIWRKLNVVIDDLEDFRADGFTGIAK